jgi:hypothetical protein
MTSDGTTRRDVLLALTAVPMTAWLASPRSAAARGTGPAKVDTKGLTAKIKYEQVVADHLGELNDKYKLRVTELVLEPGGYVGQHLIEKGAIKHEGRARAT